MNKFALSIIFLFVSVLTFQPEPMPKVVDAIVDESEIVVLCEDGSVWSWEKGKDKNTAHKIQNLNNVKKIVYAGSAIYALSEDGYVYAWGSNEWLQIDARIDEDKVFEKARKIAGFSDIADIDASIDANSSRVRAFARDKSGNFYMWGVFLHWLEDEDCYPGFPEEHIELVQGVDKVFAGAGNYHYFIREDGTIFSIMGTSFWKNENIIDFIFPSLPIEIEDYQMDNKPLDISEIYYVDLREGTKYGITILYELGQEKGIKCMDADKYTVFMSDEEGGLWYWNSKMIKYHDCKDAIADPERYREDYAGNWKSVNIKEILGRKKESGYDPYIVKICAGSENVFFLTDDGQVFMSEYITNAVEDVDYYYCTNPGKGRIITADDLHLKTIIFHKMDWKDIISINTDGTHFFSAVDKEGRYFYVDTENLDWNSNGGIAINEKEGLNGTKTERRKFEEYDESNIMYPYIFLDNSDLQNQINRQISEAITEYCGDPICSYEVDYEIKCFNQEYLSILFEGMRIPLGGSHPSDIAWGITFDMKSGKAIGIADIIEEKELQDILSKKLFVTKRGLDIDIYENLAGETDWCEKYTGYSLHFYDKEHKNDFYLSSESIGIMFGVSHAIGDYIIVEINNNMNSIRDYHKEDLYHYWREGREIRIE